MRHEIIGRNLIITASREERAQLLADFSSPDAQAGADLYDVFEPLIANSELEWIDPSETGDLTSAPMLGIREGDSRDSVVRGEQYRILQRWAYMDYQVRSPVQDLIERGQAVFVS
jgi:hypothetical protein